MSQNLASQEHLLDEVRSLTGALETLRRAQADHDVSVHDLRAQHELLRGILRTIPHAVFWKDRDSVYLGGNEHFARDAGLDAVEDIAGKTDFDLRWARAAAARFRDQDQQVMRTGIPLINYEEQVPGRDGSMNTFLCSKVPLRDESGAVIGVLGIYTDITERKEAETALIESETRFRRLVEQATDAFFVYDLNGRVLDVNHQATVALGYTRAELLDMSMQDIDLLLDADSFQRHHEEASHKNVVSFVGMHRKKDATTLPVEARVSAIEYGGKPALLSLTRDIAERLAAEEALRESERRYRQVVENATDIIYVTNAAGFCTYANSAALAAVQYPSDQLYTMHYLDLVLPQHRRRVARVYLRQYTRREQSSYVEFPFRNQSGEIIWLGQNATLIVEDGHITGFHLIARNITDRKAAEQRLLYAHSLLNATLESTTDGILVVDHEGVVRGTNQKFRDMWRIPPELAASNDDNALLQFVLDQLLDADGFLHKVRELYGHPNAESYDRICFKDGRVFERFSLPQRVEGKSVGRVWSFRDITRRLSDEAERERLQAQVLYAQKLESLGVLAGGIAHDFNNLLTGILGGTEQALQLLTPDSPAHESLKLVESTTYRAAELTRQMLAYSGRGRFAAEPLLLSDVVRDINHLIEASVSKKCSLRLHFDAGEAPIDADISQMRQVIMNLVSNASEAIGDAEGAVELTLDTAHCTRATLARAFLDENLPEGRYTRLIVHDTGCGMTPEVMGKLFDPFFSTKFTGRGLGMAAVLGIVRGHHGAILVDSAPGAGSTLTLYFPVCPQLTPPPALPPPRPAKSPAAGAILIVDDEPQVRRVAAKMLENAGYRVLVAINGAEGIEQYQAHQDAVKLVLLDMTMPRMGGKEVLARIRALNQHVPVILSSGYNEEDICRGIEDGGRLYFIQKPYRQNDLLKIVRGLVVPR